MDAAVLSALAALAGSIVGGLTSGFTTHQSIIRTTFPLYRSAPTDMMTACGETGAVSIIGR